MNGATIVQLAPDQWHIFRELQLSMAREEEFLYPGSFVQECQIVESAWQARLADGAHPLLFAKEGDRYLGMIGARSVSLIIARIVSLYIMPSERRKGIASVLLEALLRELVQKGYAKVELRVHPQAHAACALYRQFGFKERNSVTMITQYGTIVQLVFERYLV
ncbi:MAG: GNAT family N-acetyltransferase [Candidatus Babeliales bacterium]